MFEKSVHTFLESYLQFAPRESDFQTPYITENMKCIVSKIHNLIFKLFLRLTTLKESKVAKFKFQDFSLPYFIFIEVSYWSQFFFTSGL